MKLSFRVTLTTILLTLVLLTVGGLGAVSYWNASTASEELTTQVLEETSLQIDDQIHDYLNTAEELGQLNLRLTQSGRFRSGEARIQAAYWLELMKTYGEITRMSVGYAESGDWLYVRRTPSGKLVVGESRRNAETKQHDLLIYDADAFGDVLKPLPAPERVFPNMDSEDPRKRGWYQGAEKAHGQAWSETYTLFGPEGYPDIPGMSCATPFYADPDTKTKLIGVFTCTIDVHKLSEYLQTLQVGPRHRGIAFILEFGDDQAHRVVAHPKPDILLRTVQGPNGEIVKELVPAEELDDPRVPAFLKHLPEGLSPAEHQHLAPLDFTVNGVRYLGGYRGISDVEDAVVPPNWLICTVLPADEVLGSVERSNWATLCIGLAVALAAVLVGLMISRAIARPLEVLAQDAVAIGQWHLEKRAVPESMVLEVHRLALAGEEMKTSLRSFRKYVPAELVRSLMAAGQEAKVGGENRIVTIFFSDVAGFTALAEELPPVQLMEQLGEYLQAFSDEIQNTGGTVDKFIGDAVMAFWGAPAPHPDHALAACRAALGCQRRLESLRAKWKEEGKPLLFVRIGVHTGEAVVGNVGSDVRLNYTVIGDAVNLASRMEGLNKYYGTHILITAATYEAVRPALVGRPLDWVSVKGKAAMVLAYELLGAQGEVDAATLEATAVYAQGLELYRLQEWARARALFEQVRRLRPDDGPAAEMIRRCDQYQIQGPGDGWDGVHRMSSK